MTLLGALVVLLGLLMLLLADLPRRVISQLAYASSRYRKTRSPEMPRESVTPSDRASSQTMFRRSEPLFENEGLFFPTSVVTAPVVEHPGVQSPLDPEMVPAPDGPPEVDEDSSPAMRSLERLSELLGKAEDISRLLADDNRTEPGWWTASESVDSSEADCDAAITSSESPPAAWYDNPLGEGLRYWDGASWTEHIASRRHDTAPPSEAGNGTDSFDTDDQGTELPGWWFTSDPI
jgi:hypothetical protein